jgi:trigger factor
VRGKALATVVESAEVTDASGNHVELKNLQPDGTIADPTADPVEDEPAPESSVEADERPVDA